MKKPIIVTFRRVFTIFLLSFATVSDSFSNSIILDEGDVKSGKYKYHALIPYAFYSDNLGLSGGIAGGITGYIQDQLGLYGAVMVSANDSFGIYFLETKLKMPHTERLFLNTECFITRYAQYREYTNGNPLFAFENAGSNNSSKDNYIEAKGWDNKINLNFSYILPIGAGAEQAINTYILEHGVLKEGSTCRGTFNPLNSGRTFIEIIPFYHSQDFEPSDTHIEDTNSNGLGLALKYDNTDFYANPSKGSTQRVEFRRDFGAFDSSTSWSSIEFSYGKYLPLGESKWFRQQVLAFNFWTSFSPTWKTIEKDDKTVVIHGTPDYLGATLGGLYRMRAYQDRRFHDKAGIYYSAEYRVIPLWQPLKDINWFRPFEIDWWQFVFFAEAGRVAPDWDIATLNEDLKLDAGISLRVMTLRNIARLDFAFSREEVCVTAFFGHPF
jgi:outer membrane protein assembly factor BamA